ncbi:MAG: fluoride efflux transporter FluC [Actinomycetota bacterium]
MRLTLFLIGAGIGAPTRYVIDRFFRDGYRFPYGILIVNVAGSFLLGVIANQETNLTFLLFGFCGALTTWSAFALDLFDERTNKKLFAVNLFGNYLLGVFAALLGLWISR